MAQKLEQTQTQAQLQQLSTLQVALAGLVELPLADLAERVQNEMMDNAALEESAAERDGDDENESRQENGDDSGTETETEGQGGEIGDSLGDYMSEDDVPAYLQERADGATKCRLRAAHRPMMTSCGRWGSTTSTHTSVK